MVSRIKRGVTEMTKSRIKEYYKMWKKQPLRTLKSCYKKPSKVKIDVYNHFLASVKDLGGDKLSIITYNSDVFTLGYIVGDTFYIETPTKTVTAKISELEN